MSVSVCVYVCQCVCVCVGGAFQSHKLISLQSEYICSFAAIIVHLAATDFLLRQKATQQQKTSGGGVGGGIAAFNFPATKLDLASATAKLAANLQLQMHLLMYAAVNLR